MQLSFVLWLVSIELNSRPRGNLKALSLWPLGALEGERGRSVPGDTASFQRVVGKGAGCTLLGSVLYGLPSGGKS